MTTVSKRELGQDIDGLIDRVKNGETIDVTVDREVVATLVPPSLPTFDRLTRAGAVRAARSNRVDFRTLARVSAPESTASMLDDLRARTSSAHQHDD